MTNIFTLKVILEQVYIILNVAPHLRGSRTPNATDARRIFVQIALENRYKPGEIMQALEMERTGIHFLKKTFNDYIMYDDGFKAKYQIVRETINVNFYKTLAP